MPGLPAPSPGGYSSYSDVTYNSLSPIEKLMTKLKLAGTTTSQNTPQRMASHDSNPVATATTTAYGDDGGSPRKRGRLNVSDPMRNNLVAFLAEFVGTFMFLFLAFAGTQVANRIATAPGGAADNLDPSILILISLSFGFSLLANVWAFYRVSGGLFNPAVSGLFHDTG